MKETIVKWLFMLVAVFGSIVLMTEYWIIDISHYENSPFERNQECWELRLDIEKRMWWLVTTVFYSSDIETCVYWIMYANPWLDYVSLEVRDFYRNTYILQTKDRDEFDEKLESLK